MTDPIADMCTRIRNAYQVRKKNLAIPHSKVKEEIAKILVAEGYAKKIKIEGKGKEKKMLLTLGYKGKRPALTEIKRISRSGMRVYTKTDKIPPILSRLGISIISTSQGLMSDQQARKKNLGGEIICSVW